MITLYSLSVIQHTRLWISEILFMYKRKQIYKSEEGHPKNDKWSGVWWKWRYINQGQEKQFGHT